MTMPHHSSPEGILANAYVRPLVDCQSKRRIRPTKTTAKSVRFSPTSQMAVFRCQSHSENAVKWYNKDDYEYFSRVRKSDVIECSNMLTEKVGAGEPFTDDDVSLCVGLEFLLSRNVARHIQEIKRLRNIHIQVILEEQHRQMSTKNYDAEFLARLSEISSRPARERSHKLACAAL